MRDSNELAQMGLGLCIMAVVVLSLIFPWSFRTRFSRRFAHLPLLLLILYPAYEATMPPGTNIRIDVLFMWPALGLVAICYVIKLLALARSGAPGEHTHPGGPRVPPPTATPGQSPTADMERADQRLARLLPKPNNDERT